MKLKVIENYDADFTLEDSAKSDLFDLLRGDTFLAQASQACDGADVEFTELVFKPLPYSTHTPKGMAPEFERYLDSPDYLIINVPPNFMFKAKIFKPNRLCAIFRKLKA